MNDQRKSRFRFSLRARVALGVALPIFLIISAISLFHYKTEYELLDQQARLDAVQLGELMIHNLNQAMLTNENQHLISSLEDISQLENIQRIQVIGISGKVFVDSSGQISEQVFELDDVECQACHQFEEGNRPEVVPLQQPLEGWRISAPVDNLPQCNACHSASERHLGVLLMDISLQSTQKHLLENLQNDILISVISSVLVSLGAYFFVHLLVVRRVEMMQKPITEYANGDFSTRIQRSSIIDDELCDLVDTFNQMADELQRHVIEEEQRHQLRERAILEERERIARELHDGLAQVLGFVNTKAMAVRLLVKDKRLEEAERQLESLEDAARSVFMDVREAILGLRMSGHTEVGLTAALDEYVSQFSRLSGIPTAFEVTDDFWDGLISPETELHLFRIVQESLSNIRKHSIASQAWVNLDCENGLVQLRIRDNGVGFYFDEALTLDNVHFGLKSMRERAKEIGANIIVDSVPDKGTRILVELKPNGIHH